MRYQKPYFVYYSKQLHLVYNILLFICKHNQSDMIKKLMFIFCLVALISACSSSQKTCGTNGKNVGAEAILKGDKVAIKAAKKAGKFKGAN